MRGAAALALLMLAGCEAEPDFDARYEQAESRIRATAADIDAEIAARDSERVEAGEGTGAAGAPAAKEIP